MATLYRDIASTIATSQDRHPPAKTDADIPAS